MPAAAVLFDIGNVILDWEPERLYRQVFGDSDRADWFCANICTPGWHALIDGGMSFADAIAQKQAEYPEHAGEIAAWRTGWLDMFHGYVPGMARLIAELEDRRTPLFGLSNLSGEVADETFDAFPLLYVLRDVVISGDETVKKPDPEIYQIALTRMGQPDPASIFFIDDRPENIAAAEALGMIGHVFEGADTLRARLVAEGLL